MKNDPYEKENINVSFNPRKLARSVAKSNMKKAGITKLNKTYDYGIGRKCYSVFARRWKNYLNIETERTV